MDSLDLLQQAFKSYGYGLETTVFGDGACFEPYPGCGDGGGIAQRYTGTVFFRDLPQHRRKILGWPDIKRCSACRGFFCPEAQAGDQGGGGRSRYFIVRAIGLDDFSSSG